MDINQIIDSIIKINSCTIEEFGLKVKRIFDVFELETAILEKIGYNLYRVNFQNETLPFINVCVEFDADVLKVVDGWI